MLKTLLSAIALLQPSVGLGNDSAGIGIGINSFFGNGIRDLNQRLGNSRIMPVDEKHGQIPRLSANWLRNSKSNRSALGINCNLGRETISSEGLGARLKSRLQLISLDTLVSFDVSASEPFRDRLKDVGLQLGSTKIHAGMSAGAEVLTHQLHLESRLETSFVDYQITQYRGLVGAHLTLSWKLRPSLGAYVNLSSRYSHPMTTELRVANLIVSQKDLKETIVV